MDWKYMFLSEITPNTYFLLNHQSNMWKGDHWLTDILLFLILLWQTRRAGLAFISDAKSI